MNQNSLPFSPILHYCEPNGLLAGCHCFVKKYTKIREKGDTEASKLYETLVAFMCDYNSYCCSVLSRFNGLPSLPEKARYLLHPNFLLELRLSVQVATPLSDAIHIHS